MPNKLVGPAFLDIQHGTRQLERKGTQPVEATPIKPRAPHRLARSSRDRGAVFGENAVSGTRTRLALRSI